MDQRRKATDIGWNEAIVAFLRHKRRSSGVKPRTIDFYDNQLKLLVDWAREQKLTLSDFRERDFFSYMETRTGPCDKHDEIVCRECHTVSKGTQRHDIICARSFFDFCVGQDLIYKNPAATHPLPDKPKTVIKKPSGEELLALLEGMRQRWDEEFNGKIKYINPDSRMLFLTRNLAIIAGVITTGCRISEMLELKYEDFDKINYTVTFKDTKTAPELTVPFEEEWLEFLEPWLKVRNNFITKIKRAGGKPDDDLMFLSALGGPVHPDVFGKAFRGYKEFSGVCGFSLHGLRHFTATKTAQTSVMGAKALLGHKYVETTMIYAHDELEHARQTQRQAGPLRGVVSGEDIAPAKPKRRRYA